MHGNFGGKFPSEVLAIFWAPKTGTGLSCTIYKITAKFSLSLEMKPDTSNANKWYRKFRSFRKKGNTSKGLPGISGSSIHMVSAPGGHAIYRARALAS